MKKILIAAAALSLISIGGNTFAADLLDSGRIISAMQDSYNGYTYKNITNYDKFVAALEDNYNGYTYKNIHNLDSFVAQLGDGYDGGIYRNTMTMEKFVASLEDGYTPERYDALMDRTRFAVLENEDAETAAYTRVFLEGVEFHTKLVLAK